MKKIAIILLITSCAPTIPQRFQADLFISLIKDGGITCHKENVTIEYSGDAFNYYSHEDTLRLDGLQFIGPNTAESYPYIIVKGNLKREPYLFSITNTETKQTIVIGHKCFNL